VLKLQVLFLKRLVKVRLFFIILTKPNPIMQKLLLLAILSLFLSSCGSSKSASSSNVGKTEKISKTSNNTKVNKIVSYAKTFEGTRYKFGGTTKKGMDCSGLVFTAFGKEEIRLPRISRDMAKTGKAISLSQSTEGDLVFFRTSKSKRSINHVGLVVGSRKGQILFIHSTTSKGVIISSMDEDYWKSAFVEARRVM
jgi:cell wall-associated NlpC family hydrolase